MKTIKSRILISFCIAVAIVIAIIEGVVSWRLNASISRQSEMLTEEIMTSTAEQQTGYSKIQKIFFDNIRAAVGATAKDIFNDAIVVGHLESGNFKSLGYVMETTCRNSEMDFAVMFSLDGKDLVSYPEGTNPVVTEQYYRSLGFGDKVDAFVKSNADNPHFALESVSAFGPDFPKGFRLPPPNDALAGGIVIVSGGIVRGGFGDAIGICLVGKVLNHYHTPLKQMSDAIGSVCLLYYGADPIAYSGLPGNTNDRIDTSTVKLPPEIVSEVYRAEAPIMKTVSLSGNRYITTFKAIKSSAGENIGTCAVGVPEKKVLVVKRKLVDYGVATKKTVQYWLLGVGALAMAAFILVSFVIAGGIVNPINKTIKGLNDGANQMAFTSSQVSTESQDMADGSSRQAASLEEISASLEEMSSMTQQNATNADQVSGVMKEARQVFKTVADAMNQLNTSMTAVTDASAESSKIVKTIDEIAFQTNLLALNAAVEAARAGEAGAGFSVVADEVRNLAKRATEAAKATSELIQQTARSTDEGTEMVASVNQSFAEAAEGIQKIDVLIDEIAAASREQAQGIVQINKAVSDADAVTQENAAKAEEYASASEQMSAQAKQVKVVVNDLALLVDNRAYRNFADAARHDSDDPSPDRATPLVIVPPTRAVVKKVPSHRSFADF